MAPPRPACGGILATSLRGVRVQIGGEDGAVARVVDLAGLMAGNEDVDAAFDDLVDLARGEVDSGDAMRIGDHELFAIGRVGVLVEVERGGAVFAARGG